MKTSMSMLRLILASSLCSTCAIEAIAQPENDPFGEPQASSQAAVVQRSGNNSRSRAAENPFGRVEEPQPTPAPNRALPQPAERPQAEIGPQATLQDTQLCRCLGETGGAAERITKAINGPLKSRGLEYSDTALEQVAAEFAAEYGIPIQMDISALEEQGLSADEPISVNLHGISLRSALNHMLKSHQLTYVIQDEVLLITTTTVAEEMLKICLYDIRDLIASPQDVTGLESIKNVILSCIAPDTWAAGGGGTAELQAINPGLVAISQTSAVHEEIQELLTLIRQMSKQPPAAAANARANPGQVVTRHYVINVAKPDDQDAFQRQLRTLIISQSPDQTWGVKREDGQATLLSVLQDRVIVRHTEAVQRHVESLLVDMGMTTRARTASTTAGGQGGFGGGGFGGGGGGGGFFRPQTPPSSGK